MNVALKPDSIFNRSVNIERDANNPAVLETFVPSSTALNVLNDMAEALASGQAAFTWTGAYGSGKSLLAVVFDNLFAELEDQDKSLTAEKLGQTICSAYKNLYPHKSPVVVRLIAKSENLEQQVVTALSKQTGLDFDDCDDDLELILTKCSKSRPVVLIVDELGKFFDACARKNADVFVLQTIAEFANRSKHQFVFLGLLHQAFSQYALSLGTVAANEWSKVQGRFMDIPFNLSLEEQVQLLRSRLQGYPSSWEKSLTKSEYDRAVKSIRESVPWLTEEKIDDLHPLCPLTGVLLGAVSRQAFSQNQRSLFSFLNSSEAFSFQSVLSHAGKGSAYRIFDLWNYLNANFESSIANSPMSKDWYLSIDCVNRADRKINPTAVDIVKAISIFQVFGARYGIRADIENIRTALNHVPAKTLSDATQLLLKNKIIVYREVADFFALSDSSDFDLSAELENIELTEDPHSYLNSGALKPVIAKRHYIETGNMRWLKVEFVSLKALLSMDQEALREKIFVCLTDVATTSAIKSMKSFVSNVEVPVAILLPANTLTLGLAIERRAKLMEVAGSSIELKVDRVARKEVDFQLSEVEAVISAEVENVYFDGTWVVSKYASKSTGTWNKIAGGSHGDLNSNVSSLFDAFYPDALVIKNELANRTKLSSNATSALKSLMLACLSAENREDLGIIGTPPERTIYTSLIKKYDLHRYMKATGSFGFETDERSRQQAPIMKLWRVAETALSGSGNSLSGQDIFKIWEAPPFGLKRGIFPMILLLFILTNRHKLAVYYEGVYQVEITPITVEWLIKSPTDFTFALAEHEESEEQLQHAAEWLSRYAGHAVEPSPLGVGRALKTLQRALPKWALNTRLLSGDTLQFRDELKKAHDPIDLVYNKLPEIFGSDLQGLQDSVQELNSAYSIILDQVANQLFADFRLKDDKSGRDEINARAKNIKKRTGDFDLESFVNQLEQFDGSERASEDLLMHLIKKDPRAMIDQDVNRSAIILSEKIMAFQKVEAHARFSKRGIRSRAMSLVYAPSENKGVVSVDVRLTSADLKLAENKAQEIRDLLDGLDPVEKEIALGAIALYLEDKVVDDE